VINFRYHVVSLTAVFLALAIGLVVGTAALNGPAADALNDRVNALSRQNQQYRDQLSHLEEEVNKQEQFATEAAPIMLDDKLLARRVLVVAMASASKYVDGVVQNLQLAGAKVTARVEIQDRFTDPGNNEELLDLAHLSTPASVSGLPLNSNGVETSSALLAAVLMNRTPNVPADHQRTVLSAYSRAGYIIITGEPTGIADSVVVVAGPPYVDREASRKNAAVVTMVDQFDRAGPIVVAGTGTGGDGNVLAQLRGDPTLTKSVSTVDNVATALGRVVVALAMAEQEQGHAGHYGIDSGAGALMPKPTTSANRSGS
jgi:copper transport outer membrane protein MctB